MSNKKSDKALSKNVNVKVEPLKIEFSIPKVTVSYTSELNPILDLNKKRCKHIFNKSKKRNLKVKEIADFLLSLHLVLEISINTLMRKLSLRNKKVSNEDMIKMVENFDNISYLDKVIMFIYNTNFVLNTDERKQQVKQYEKIIGYIKNFNETRNALVHGHTMISGGPPDYCTKAYGKIKKDNMESQIALYKKIIQGISFYLDCLDNLSDKEKQNYKEMYLDDSFL